MEIHTVLNFIKKWDFIDWATYVIGPIMAAGVILVWTLGNPVKGPQQQAAPTTDVEDNLARELVRDRILPNPNPFAPEHLLNNWIGR